MSVYGVIKGVNKVMTLCARSTTSFWTVTRSRVYKTKVRTCRVMLRAFPKGCYHSQWAAVISNGLPERGERPPPPKGHTTQWISHA